MMTAEPLSAQPCPPSCSCVPRLHEADRQAELFTEGDGLYEAMLASIVAAERSVYLESYIFADDEIGWRFAKALAERARAGVDVRLHIDAAGFLLRGSRRLRAYLHHKGVLLRLFHRWSWRQPQRYNRRNHRKLLVADAHTLYLGGFNIHRENSRALYGDARWRDTHVRLDGSMALQATDLFGAFWSGGRAWIPTPTPRSESVLVPNASRRCRRRLRCLYAGMFAGARRSLYITTPYLVPDPGMLHKLIAAARRGVDVRVLVPAESDVRLAHWAAQMISGELLAGGVRVYEYLPRMLHAKTAVADSAYGSVGTANLDYRSFPLNYELNLFTRDAKLCSQLREQFLEDLREARELSLVRWRQWHWRSRVLQGTGWLVQRWL